MRQPSQFGRVLAAILGLVLAVFMTVEVAHSHATSAGNLDAAGHCQLCATAHVAVAGEPALSLVCVLHVVGAVVLVEPTRGSRILVRTALIRPPPSVDFLLV